MVLWKYKIDVMNYVGSIIYYTLIIFTTINVGRLIIIAKMFISP